LVAEIDEAQESAIIEYASSPSGKLDKTRVYRLSEFVNEELIESLRAGESLVIRNTQTDPRTKAKAHVAFDVYSYVAVPLHRDGRLKYLFSVSDSAPRDWREDEIELIRELTSRIFPRLERARAEEALRVSERQFHELADSMPQLVWVDLPNGDCIYLNRRWYEQMGVGPDQSLGEQWADLLHPDDRTRSLNYLHSCIATGEPYETEHRIRNASGEYRWFLSRALPARDDQGHITHWYGTSTDIQEKKCAEEQLRQTQKLESVGLLAGGIAHDFNNLLTAILGNASLVLDEIGPGPAERIREVISSAERAASLTRQLLAYTGKGHFVVRDLDVSEAVQEISGLVEFSIPKSVELVLNVQKRLPAVRMDPSHLQQILMNLVINAGEAIGEGNSGKITISTRITDVAKPFVDAIGEEIAPGRYVCIEVTDTGIGISEENKSKIFDPFFTTKFTGRGLGLAALAGMLRSHKGGITVGRAEGRGSIFRVFLGVSEKQAGTSETPVGGDKRGIVLVVDDVAPVRDFLATVLRRQGYRVLTAADGREALAVFDRENGHIDAMVLDVVMPLMGANDLLPKMRARQPDLKVLLTSGSTESESRHLRAGNPGVSFIQKPYTAQQVAGAVDELMRTSDANQPRPM
jgi:PAS domain S-box-containing protein